jgi:hypothetical protein
LQDRHSEGEGIGMEMDARGVDYGLSWLTVYIMVDTFELDLLSSIGDTNPT